MWYKYWDYFLIAKAPLHGLIGQDCRHKEYPHILWRTQCKIKTQGPLFKNITRNLKTVAAEPELSVGTFWGGTLRNGTVTDPWGQPAGKNVMRQSSSCVRNVTPCKNKLNVLTKTVFHQEHRLSKRNYTAAWNQIELLTLNYIWYQSIYL